MRLLLARAARLQHPVAEHADWASAEVRRNDVTGIVQAGVAIGRYDARPWASSLGVPAASLVTTRDRLVPPRKQRALAEALATSGEATRFASLILSGKGAAALPAADAPVIDLDGFSELARARIEPMMLEEVHEKIARRA